MTRVWSGTWRERWTWILASPLLLFSPYWITNHLPVREAREVGLTAFDRAIPFLPWATPVYLLLFPMMHLIMVLLPLPLLRRWMAACAVCCWTVAVVFVVWPTEMPRPVEASGWWTYDALIRHDEPRNISPSLHGTFAVLNALTLASYGGRIWGLVAGGVSVVVILATIAVRQHGIVDLAAGGLIGLCAWWWWVGPKPGSTVAESPL